MAVIGIDLGTTNCAASRFINGESEIINLEGRPKLPSLVGVLPGGKIVVGWTAKRYQSKYPQNTVVEVKRKMGYKVSIPLGQDKFTPQEISSMILKKIKDLAEDDLGEKITGAVITCPAYFKEPQREATKEAGQLAGINVLRVVNEPTAAAYAYGFAQQDESKKNLFLVYDLGGGTFDVTVISMVGGNLKVIGTGGDPQLGGGDFDDRIVDWMMKYIEKIPGYANTLTEEKRNALKIRLKSYAEEGKKILCGPPPREEYQFQISAVDKLDGRLVPFNETLTMEKFNELISDLVKNSLKWIETAMKVPKEKLHYTEEDITEILLVGGSTRVPLVQDVLKERFPNTPIRGVKAGVHPDEIVAVGAGIIAAENDPDIDEVPQNVLIDVTGHSLSFEVYDVEENKLRLSRIIEKETPIPTSATHQFFSAGNFTPAARIKIWQGEGEEIDPEKVTMIGEFEIPLDKVKEPIPLEFGLTLDENGILIAHAKNLINGQQFKCELVYKGSAKMSQAELEKRKKNLESQMKYCLESIGGGEEETVKKVNKLGNGRVLFNPPAEMQVGVKERIEVRISRDLEAYLNKGLKGRGVPQIEKINISTVMKAELSGDDFQIESLSEKEQLINPAGYTQWEWNVTPSKPGRKVIHLSISVIINIDRYGREKISLPVMEREIKVKVNFIYGIKRNWKWIVGTMIALIGTIITLLSLLKN